MKSDSLDSFLGISVKFSTPVGGAMPLEFNERATKRGGFPHELPAEVCRKHQSWSSELLHDGCGVESWFCLEGHFCLF